jgi:hypothetical protein
MMLHHAFRPWTGCRLRGCTSTLLLSFAVIACGGTSEPATNPLPALISVEPSQLVAGSSSATVTLTGSGFVRGSQVRWNDADRVTHFQTEQTLTVDLSASDLATVAIGKLTVVNGAPGGGTSGELSLPIGYPAPKITAISPTTTAIQTSGSVTITITGTGFVPQSGVRVGSNLAFPSSVTATQIVATLSSFALGTPGTLPVTVVNPAPGGGTSNAIDFGVTYPVPALGALSPDSSFTGSPFTLTANGTGFGTGSRIRWNGQDRPTTFVSATRLTAAIPASDVGSPTAATVSVFNPTPGGGSSNPLTFRIVEPAPVITSISPGVVTAGSGSATITINGSNFRTGATVQWNGASRTASLISSTSMTVTLTSSDIATATVGKITVTNPGPSGTSNTLAVAVVASGASLSVVRTITITHADLVFDELRGVLYASIPSSASQNPNSIVRIDPASGSITGVVAVGSNPGTLAITDDDQYLYVGLLGAPTVVRVALASFTKDIDISIPGDSFLGSAYAEDIQPISGAPQTFAVSTFYTGVSPRNSGTYLFDNATRRPASGPGHTGSNRITRGPDASRIYGYNNETTEFGFRSVLVAADGLREETVKSGLIGGFGVDIEYSGGFVYATTGEVASVPAMQKVGTIPAGGYVRPDAANARVHFLNGSTINTYHYSTYVSLGTFTDPALASHTRLIRWGTDGLAVAGGSTIVLLRGGLVAQ